MSRSTFPAHISRRTLDDVNAAWEQVAAAAAQGARQAREASRRRGATARQRGAAAVTVLRGGRVQPVRWLVAGFAAGAVAGTVVGVLLSRRLPDAAESRQRAEAAARAVRARAGAATSTTVNATRVAGQRLRGRLGNEPASDPAPGSDAAAPPATGEPRD